MADLDERLHDLASMPTPALDHLEGAVFSRIHELATVDRRAPRRMAVAVAIAATALGVASTGLPPIGDASAQAPSFDGSQLAPSQLLMGEP